MPKPASDLEGGLAALAGVSLRELAEIDDAALDAALGQILRGASEASDRLWSQGGCVE